MKLRQKIASLFVAAVTAVSALSVTAFAADPDPVGSGKVIELKEGEEATEIIKYSEGGEELNDGQNYLDFHYTAPADGTLLLTVDAAINDIQIRVYEGEYKTEIRPKEQEAITGGVNNYCKYYWDENAGLCAVTAAYEVKATDYTIRVSRGFHWTDYFNYQKLEYGYGMKGTGRIHITAEMKKPDAPTDIKVTTKTDTSISLTWTEPELADSYDIRYKASNAKSWTTVEDIKDNKATVKNLKGGTKYSYCIRSKAGEIVGEWSKAATVTTSDPKNVKIAAPTVNNAKLTAEISWKAVKNATGYNVKYSTDKKNWTTVKVTETSCYISVTAGKTYYYAVQGRNSAKTGSWSATKSIKIG